MTKLTDFAVVREHLGDKWYEPGDTRTVNATEVAHLVPHVLEPIGDAKAVEPKAEPTSADKAEPAPANKAEPEPANKNEPTPANKAAPKGKTSAKGASAPTKGD